MHLMALTACITCCYTRRPCRHILATRMHLIASACLCVAPVSVLHKGKDQVQSITEHARTRLSMPRMPRQRYSYDSAIAMTMLRALQLEKRRPRQRYSYDHRDPCDNCDGHRGLDAARIIRAEGLVLFGVGGPRCAGGLRRVYHPAL